MCVPGPITSATSAGCHQFLRDRPDAVLVTKADEVVEQCGHMGELAEPVTAPAVTRDLLGPTVARVLEGVPVRGAADVASIARTVGTNLDVTASSLAALLTLGLVQQTDGKWGMTTEARRDRRARSTGIDQLALDWW
jgi:DNA processing protein